MSPAAAFATVGGVGYLRPAPGTWGSLAALPLAWVIAALLGPSAFVIAIVLVTAVGILAIQRMTAGTGNHDPSEVVIDEVAGQWIALLPVVYGAVRNDVSLLALWPGWLAAFVLFRLFDILKPGPIGWADRQETAVGTMLDDLIAGVFAALVVAFLGALWHLVIL